MENNIKQFNLQEYLAHPNRPVITRDGSPVRIVCTDRKVAGENTKPILALVYDKKTCQEDVHAYTTDGKAIDIAPCLDLLFAPIKYERWLNIYDNRIQYYPGPRMYNTEQEAKEGRAEYEPYVTSVKIEWEE